MKPEDERSEWLDLVASDCVAVRVRIINRVLSAVYDEALRPYGLRVSQANVLVAVVRLREARPVDVCRVLRLDKSTLSRDVEIMKRQGWLESDPPSGGRNQVLRVTSKGLDLLDRSRPAWEAAQEKARGLIGDSGAEALGQIARKLGLGAPAG